MRIPVFRTTVIAICLAASLLPAVVAISQNAPANASTAGDESKLAGAWRGDSLCEEKGNACHDEAAAKYSHSWLSMHAAKAFLAFYTGK